MAWGPGRSLRDNLDRKASASYMLTGKNEERPNGNAGRAICLLTGCYGSYNGFYFFYFFIFNFLNKFIYLFLAMLGLHCCACSFSSRGERGMFFIAVCGLLIAVASLVVEHGLWARRLQ